MNILWYNFKNVFLECFFKFVWLNKVVNWKKMFMGDLVMLIIWKYLDDINVKNFVCKK